MKICGNFSSKIELKTVALGNGFHITQQKCKNSSNNRFTISLCYNSFKNIKSWLLI